MQYRTLGRTGIKVSALGFGAMRLPTAGSAEQIDEATATEMLHAAIDAGVNYVDTAWFYHAKVFGERGFSEPFVGRALAGGWREKVYVATKLPQQLVRTRAEMDRFLEEQLQQLQTDHIDFYLVHGVNGEAWDRMRALGVREFLDGARQRGLIGFPAFSFHGEKDDFPRIVDDYDHWAMAQIQYNYVDTDYQAGLAGLRCAAEKGLGVVVMEPLKGGHLANKAPEALRVIFAGRPEGWSAAEWALRYLWHDGRVNLVLSGMSDAAQVADNLRIADAARAGGLSAEQLEVFATARAALAAALKANCTNCRYCQPCAQGVEIPKVLEALNAAATFSTKDQWITGYGLVKGGPELCNLCGECEQVCPQALPIRKLLVETEAWFQA
jgi:uncharacterized protein